MRLLIAVAAIIATVIGVAVLAVWEWDASGPAEVSWQGWLAMGLGTVATAALGGGLMALVFYSSRQGYDDAAGTFDPLPQDRDGGPGEGGA